MSNTLSAPMPSPATQILTNTCFTIIAAISFSHLLNDMMQSLMMSLYPMLKDSLQLSFAQIGLISLTYQMTGSLLQPLIGLYTDRSPKAYSLPVAMMFTMCGLLLLAHTNNFYLLLAAASLVGMGSSIFHPESSRVARLAAGSQPGLAQSLFQVGGNMGSALGPLLAALIILPNGRESVTWFSLAAMLGAVVLFKVSGWYKAHMVSRANKGRGSVRNDLTKRQIIASFAILGTLVFSKYFYMASLTNYYTFYLIDKFQLSLKSAQLYLFAFLFAVAVGTIVGGPIGDRIGRKRVIWVSILGVAPFTLLMPHVNLFWTGILSVIIGFTLASAFSAILVFAQELVPGKVGAISGLFFGFAFGMAGIGAALLGKLADSHGVATVYQVCAYLPLLGLLTAYLPNLERKTA